MAIRSPGAKRQSPYTKGYAFFFAILLITGVVVILSGGTVLWAWLLGACAGCFLLCGVDKGAALRGESRTPEAVFFTGAVLGGALGLVAGMKLFRHKTRKASFQVVVFVVAVLQLLFAMHFRTLLG